MSNSDKKPPKELNVKCDKKEVAKLAWRDFKNVFCFLISSIILLGVLYLCGWLVSYILEKISSFFNIPINLLVSIIAAAMGIICLCYMYVVDLCKKTKAV